MLIFGGQDFQYFRVVRFDFHRDRPRTDSGYGSASAPIAWLWLCCLVRSRHGRRAAACARIAATFACRIRTGPSTSCSAVSGGCAPCWPLRAALGRRQPVDAAAADRVPRAAGPPRKQCRQTDRDQRGRRRLGNGADGYGDVVDAELQLRQVVGFGESKPKQLPAVRRQHGADVRCEGLVAADQGIAHPRRVQRQQEV